MKAEKIAVKSRTGEVGNMRLPGAEYEQGLETVKRIAVRTRGGQLVTVGIPGEYVRNARTVQGVATADILSGETVYGAENKMEFRDKNGVLIRGGNVLPSPDGKVLAVDSEGTWIFRLTKDGLVPEKALERGGGPLAFSPDGKLLVVEKTNSYGACIYSVGEQVTTYLSDLPTTVGNNYESAAAFSPDGTVFLYSENEENRIKIFSVNGTEFTYVGDVAQYNSGANIIRFSPDGSLVVVQPGSNSTYLLLAEGTSITYSEMLDTNMDWNPAGGGDVGMSLDFSPDGSLLVLGGVSGAVYVYSVAGTTVTKLQEKTVFVTDQTESGNYIDSTAFSPDGKTLALCGRFPGNGKIYSVDGDTFTFARNIFTDIEGDLQMGGAKAAFSKDGSQLYASVWNLAEYKYGMYVFEVEGTVLAGPGATILYPAPEGKIPAGDYLVGFAKGPMEKGETGTARIIGEVSA